MQNINAFCVNAMLGKAEWAERILKALFTSFALDGGKRLAAFPPIGRTPVSQPRDWMGHAGPPKIWKGPSITAKRPDGTCGPSKNMGDKKNSCGRPQSNLTHLSR
jgi:hypothetical protein